MVDQAKKYLPYELFQMYRSRLGWTQTQLAAELGLSSKRMVQYWEAGTYLPKAESLKKLIAGFLQHHIFVVGQELEEACQLWQAVKDASDTRLDNLTPYPVFDKNWFDQLLKNQPTTEAANPVLAVPAPAPPTSTSGIVSPSAFKSNNNNLPVPPNDLIGREKEVQQLSKLLATQKARLVSLVGAGGMGKTRLALEVGNRLIDYYQDGVWLVELASLSDPALLAASLMAVLDISPQAGQSLTNTLSRWLYHKQLLLVLDNCEHLVEACARLAQTLLQECPTLQILATSRELFNIPQEVTFLVPALGLPELTRLELSEEVEQTAAIELFIQRASVALPTLQLSSQGLQTIAQICHQLDGIPLALELAAARTRILSLEELAQRLGQRFSLLTGGSRTALPRHQTLAALIDWSYELLPPTEQNLFRHLALFVGGWTLEAVEALEEDLNSQKEKKQILDLLAQLVNKSLVLVEGSVAPTRYRMLETIRAYALTKLEEAGEREAVQQCHLNYYLNLCKKLEIQINEKEGGLVLTEIMGEYDNLRSAFEGALGKNQTEQALQLAVILGLYWDVGSMCSQGRYYLKQALQLGTLPSRARGRALGWACLLALRQGDATGANEAAQQGLENCRAINDKAGMSGVLNCLGLLTTTQGDYEAAHRYLEESLKLAREAGNKLYTTAALLLLGNLANTQEEYSLAFQYYEMSLEVAREIDHQQYIAVCLNGLGVAMANQGKYEPAYQYYTDSIALARTLIDTRTIIDNLVGLARCLVGFGLDKATLRQRPEQLLKAAQLSGGIASLLVKIGGVLWQPEHAHYEQLLVATQQGLDQEEFSQAFQQGQTMSLDNTIALVSRI